MDSFTPNQLASALLIGACLSGPPTPGIRELWYGGCLGGLAVIWLLGQRAVAAEKTAAAPSAAAGADAATATTKKRGKGSGGGGGAGKGKSAAPRSGRGGVAGSGAAAPTTPAHPLLLRVLKGHQEEVAALAFSPDGRWLATCSPDRTIRCFARADMGPAKKGGEVRCGSVGVELDDATALSFSADSRFVCAATSAGKLQFFGVKGCGGQGKLEKVKGFKTGAEASGRVHSALMLGSGDGTVVATASGHDETFLRLYAPKGGLLQTAKVLSFTRGHARRAVASPDHGLVALPNNTAELKVFARTTNSKTGAFEAVAKAYVIAGHANGAPLRDLSFGGAPSAAEGFPTRDPTAVTISASEWVLWDLDVDWRRDEKPREIARHADAGADWTLVALSPRATVVAAAQGRRLTFFGARSGAVLADIELAHDAAISALAFSPEGECVACAASNSKHVRVFACPQLQ
jgi:WD40 repeat protein